MKKTRWNLLVIVMLVLMPAIVWAQNLPPVADAGEDQNLLVDELTYLEGNATDPDGDFIVSWQWTLESSPAGSSPYISDLNRPDPQFRTSTAGDYVLSLIACDALLCSESDSVTIHVAEILPPVLIMEADVTSGQAPLTVNFDGSGSYDPQGGDIVFNWEFGYNTTSSGLPSPSHTYSLAGIYIVELTVRDSIGQRTRDTIEITVTAANTAPTVSPTASPTSGVAPLDVQFAANGYDADGDALTYAWDFGDGDTSTLADPAHVYAAGTYEAWVTVSDGVDEASASVTIHVTDYEVHEISQEEGRYPMINDRRDCIWIGASGGLFFYDAFTGETKLLDAAATTSSDYEINNNGDVGWAVRWHSNVWVTEVYVYDHSSRTTVQVTNNDGIDAFYKITDDGTVYFVSKQADGTFTLNTYVIDSGVTTTIADLYQFAQWPKAINANGDVLWRVRDSSYNYVLYLYSATTGTTVPISPLDSRAFDPSMNDRGDVSYRLFESDYHAILFYDASTGQVKELTRGAPNNVWEPKTSNSGNVVWTGSDTAADIFYYDYALKTVEQLTFLTDYFWYGFWDKDINDLGDSAWIDWTPRANTGTELNIYLYEEGRIEIINTVTNPEWPQINNKGDAVFEGDNAQPWGRGVYLATRAATVDEVVDTIEELTTTGSLDTTTAEELQTSFDKAMEALSAGDETEAEKKIVKFEGAIDKAEKKGDLDGDNAKKLEDALKEVVSSY